MVADATAAFSGPFQYQLGLLNLQLFIVDLFILDSLASEKEDEL